jgi:hypothetical protein
VPGPASDQVFTNRITIRKAGNSFNRRGGDGTQSKIAGRIRAANRTMGNTDIRFGQVTYRKIC